MRASLVQWAKDVGRWWWAVVVVVLAVLSLFALVSELRHHIAWLMVAVLAVGLVASFLAYHKLHVRSEGRDPRRSRLREDVDAAIRRGNYLASASFEHVFAMAQEFGTWANANYKQMDKALGPEEAEAFWLSANPTPGAPTDQQLQWEITARVEWLTELLDRLEDVPIMGDWHP